MLPELQGRLPIRVELNGLTEDDLYKILTVPEANVSILFSHMYLSFSLLSITHQSESSVTTTACETTN